jgi:DNA-binding IclR family transcriptional regulator
VLNRRGVQSEARELEASASGGLRTAARVLAVVELLTGVNSGRTVSEVAEDLKIPVSSAHVLLRRLAELGYLRTLPGTRRYAVGGRLARLGLRLQGALDVETIAQPHLRQLAKAIAEEVCLAVYDGPHLSYGQSFEGFHRLRLSLPAPQPGPILGTAAGKLYFARLSDPELEAALAGDHLEREEWDDMHRELAMIRARDHATAAEGPNAEVLSFAAPVHDAAGHLVAAVVVRLARRRLGSARPNLVSELLATARTVSQQLGWQPVD